jgi:hypothetical protein
MYGVGQIANSLKSFVKALFMRPPARAERAGLASGTPFIDEICAVMLSWLFRRN